MNARLLALAAVIACAAPAAAESSAGAQAQAALGSVRAYDGARQHEPIPVVADGVIRRQAAAADAGESVATGGAPSRAGAPTPEPPSPSTVRLSSWNPLLNGAKGAALMGIVGFVLGGPLGALVGAAIGGAMAWGMTKIGDA